MKPLQSIIIMGFFSALFSCNSSTKSNEPGSIILEEIGLNADTSEGGFCDISLKIESDIKTDSSHIYIAKGLYTGKTVGLKLEIKSDMANGLLSNGEGMDPENGFIRDAITLFSIGEESNALVKALSELYSFPTTKPFSKKIVIPTIFSLNQTVAKLDKPGYYKFKLFFEEENEKLYSELFLNINTELKIIELNEKDQEYREPIINVFTK